MSSLANVLYKIEQLYSEWQSLQPVSKENEDRLWKKFRLEWNYNSNHIEGNTLTYGETQLLLLFDKTTGDHEMREFEEMKAHDVAIKAIQEWSSDKGRELTESDIRDLNRIILVRPYWKEALTYDGQSTRRKIKVGEYKEHPNSVRLSNGEMFHYAKPEEVAAKMNDLMDWFKNNQALPPVVLAAEMHYRFIVIHPFDDGNGRIARLLVNYILMRNDLPPIVIKSEDKSNYLTALNKADAGNREAFHQYIAEQLVWSLEIAVKAANGKSVEEDDDLDKEIELLTRKAAISKIIAKKSRKVIQDNYQSSIKNLYKSIENKLVKFDALFVGVYRDFIVYNNNNLASKSWENIEAIEEEILNYSHEKFYDENFDDAPWERPAFSEIKEIVMKFSWEGYKNSDVDNAFSLSCLFTTQFDDYGYQISFGWPMEEKLLDVNIMYNSHLSDGEVVAFVNQAAKYILDEIKNKEG